MVKFRGIEISIVSQFDIRKLPEFKFRHTSPSPESRLVGTNKPPSLNPTASCYVPVYPGSQIWLDYNIDPPHPPKATYFFKLLFNGKIITSFDCGSRHDYHGKMVYSLVAQGTDKTTGAIKVVRQALYFSSQLDHSTFEPHGTDDTVEIRVHRVENRKRIKDLIGDRGLVAPSMNQADKLQLADGGILEPGFPKRRYTYQLLDPVDEPYATFQFFCCSYDSLKRRGIVDPATESRPSSLSSNTWRNFASSPRHPGTLENQMQAEQSSPVPSPPRSFTEIVSSPSNTTVASKELEPQVILDKHNSLASSGSYLPPSDSDEDLSIVRDSIEDLPSTVSRSPKSSRRQPVEDDSLDDHPLTGSLSLRRTPRSPRRRLKKKLMVNLNGADFDLEKNPRPLSPFTSGGMLRKHVPPSAPAVVTEFGPSIRDDVEFDSSYGNRRDAALAKQPVRTTRTERGGKSLIGFLSRRAGAK